MVLVCNVKPIMGELEFKIEKRPKLILYFKISLNEGRGKIRNMSDFKIRLDYTQIIQHFTNIGPVFEKQLEGEEIDLDQIIDILLEEHY